MRGSDPRTADEDKPPDRRHEMMRQSRKLPICVCILACIDVISERKKSAEAHPNFWVFMQSTDICGIHPLRQNAEGLCEPVTGRSRIRSASSAPISAALPARMLTTCLLRSGIPPTDAPRPPRELLAWAVLCSTCSTSALIKTQRREVARDVQWSQCQSREFVLPCFLCSPIPGLHFSFDGLTEGSWPRKRRRRRRPPRRNRFHFQEALA
ncbi:hypothetical protein GA0061099_1004118 [Bradyrhizobium yuanmingense]|uniref:Uncharacterized protein n=1 Tax=Bradyrhizobium yuanmingense TaxID=108015 RepID=A0A1C3VK69_9BRAD|nr:hypothetical protein IQ15_01877 [Bradyrhizobium yuanmingense]SCB28136.1 hypothetical protein GA0061099_1004118 [Bradyrhizobium yuanmingense]